MVAAVHAGDMELFSVALVSGSIARNEMFLIYRHWGEKFLR
jgi:hypothetical protein